MANKLKIVERTNKADLIADVESSTDTPLDYIMSMGIYLNSSGNPVYWLMALDKEGA